MSFSFFPGSKRAIVVSLSLAGVACKGTSTNPAAPPVEECPAPPAADQDGSITVAPYEGFANGTASGMGIGATLCNAEILISDFNGSTSGPTFTLDSTAAFASTTVTLPAGALAGTLSASITVPTPAAGVYSSSDAQACGSLTFSYATVDGGAGSCDVGPGAVCPSGCRSVYVCADAASIPCCVPLGTTYVYQAAASSSCNGQPQTGLGSWKLTLTDVTAYQDDASAQYGQHFYLAHGSLSATLQGTTDTTNAATLSLTF